ncbi:ATP-binding protein [Amycolatopsis thermalba]|uniref:ATP-binding protein n=1 Tax=Amycolatopsis thermalba TaxID=944492 RepID=A0ABY4NXI6_9PSEU|nr:MULTISPECIES: ATP-binding protein [Amycolatopsis]UQS24790.1 ATP-binding protein [Amycolatopsis thermalba]
MPQDVGEDRSRDLRARRPARAAEVPGLRHAVRRWADVHGVPPQLTADVELAVHEALANAIEHAYPEGATGIVALHARQDDGALQITVTDHGQWQPPAAGPGPDGGRGLALIDALADHASITGTEHGTTVTLACGLTAR